MTNSRNPNNDKKMGARTRGSKRGWVALAGRVPPEKAVAVLLDCQRRGLDRSDWIAEAVLEKLARAA